MSKPVIDTTPRLVRFRIDHPSLPPPLNSVGKVNVAAPDYRLDGWGLRVRGAVVFLVSPRGWKQGKHKNECDVKGPVTVIGPIPMAHVTLEWEGDDADAVDKLQRYDLPAMTKAMPVADEMPALDAKEIGDA